MMINNGLSAIPKGLLNDADLSGQELGSIQQDIPVINDAVKNMFPSIKNVIGISSGKGGVGKSTVCANLAKSLAGAGAKVGVLDADIYGPSIPTLFNVAKHKAQATQERVNPVIVDGVELSSIGFLVEPEQALAWRGPMATGALLKLIQQTAWGELDYLLIDMPPGTGDIQLTLAQKVPMTAAVVITTPHALSLADASKGISLFNKVEIPVLGIVENMASVTCSQCGHEQAIFAGKGAKSLAEQFSLDVLGSLPVDTDLLTEQASMSEAMVAAFLSLARTTAIKLLEKAEQLQDSGPEIEF